MGAPKEFLLDVKHLIKKFRCDEETLLDETDIA